MIKKVTVTQSCPTLRAHGLHSPWNSAGQNTGVGSGSLLQGIVPIQGLNPSLPCCRQILHQLSHQGSPSGKESTCHYRKFRRCSFNPWGGKILLEKEMATHSSMLTWKIPWTEVWWATVHGVTQSWTQLSTHTHTNSWYFVKEVKGNERTPHVLFLHF